MANVVAEPVLTATVIAVCDGDRMGETSAALERLRGHSAVRTILISLGTTTEPPIDADRDVISIAGLVPKYLNNAVASLRLSSLPSLAWWRGGDATLLADLAELVDRLVIDAHDPREAWARVPKIAEVTMVSDLRWTKLTRWRNLMAQFFDVPDVRAARNAFTDLEITGSDRHAARLFGGWLSGLVPQQRVLRVAIDSGTRARSLERVVLRGPECRLSLELAATSACIHTSIESAGRPVTSRAVPLGDHEPDALMALELRVRARDLAFERALQASARLS